MLAAGALTPFFSTCAAIGNESIDGDGFVPVRKLLTRFQTTLKIRPLLVEGMLASVSSNTGSSSSSSRWVVLVDSERYSITDRDLQSESSANSLPARFRFTVAHELAHSLAFRPTEFGITLASMPDKSESRAALVEAIEKETDRLAPLLLCSEQTLTERLRHLTGPLNMDFLTNLGRDLGVSRYVLLNRLSLSLSMDSSGLWQRPHLREVGVGIGERGNNGNIILRRWPLFVNFSRGTVPRPFLLLRQQDRVPLEVAFGEKVDGHIGTGEELALVTEAGTSASPAAERMTIEIVAESNSRIAGSSFLFLVRNQQVHKAIKDFESVRLTGHT